MKSIYLLLILLAIACSDPPEGLPYESSEFVPCNDSLSMCDFTGDYCLFGLKWGGDNDFSNVGPNAAGPQVSGGIISYSFQERPSEVSNHRQVGVPTQSFDMLPACAKEKIRMAFDSWSSVADLQFTELEDDQDADIEIYVAFISTGGAGFPNYTSTLCQQLAGHVILSPKYTEECDIFEAYVLHEIGHALGLGHSSTENLMGSINTNLGGLKPGDIEGIRQIYGQ